MAFRSGTISAKQSLVLPFFDWFGYDHRRAARTRYLSPSAATAKFTSKERLTIQDFLIFSLTLDAWAV
jgi:hypothetical protein